MLTVFKLKDRVACRKFREFVASLVCAICGKLPPCDPAHVVSRKRGDGSDLGCIPACRHCHRKFDDAGKNREAWFLGATGITVAEVQLSTQNKFRRIYGLSEDVPFEQAVRDAGFIEQPFTRRKNRKIK